jgi:zeaxanthin epoxidase
MILFLSQMMPNLGQGGCQAIEDGFILTDLLCGVTEKSQLKGVLQEYYRKRIVRSAIIQGMSRISSDIIISAFSTPFNLKGKNRKLYFYSFVQCLISTIYPFFS